MPELIKTILANNTNLKAYYRFESGALTTDSSGQGKTLTNNNAVGEGTGVYGVCADFGSTNSTKSFNRTPDILSHAEIAAGWTFNMWIKTADITAANELFRYISNDGTYERNLESYINTNGSIEIIVYDGTGKKLTTAASIVSINNFYLVSFTYDGTTLRTYLNGAMVASSGLSWSNYARTAYSNFSIGAEQLNNGDGVSDLFKGLIDDFSVFNVALSADQIKELYEGRYLGELRPNQFGTTAGLWHLNGNSTDSSGNNNHGTDTAITYSQANGKFGQGAGFDGSTSKIDMGTSNTFNFTGDFTILMWINPTSIANAAQLVRRGSSNGYQFQFDTTNARLALAPRGLTTVYSSNNAIAAGSWQLSGLTRSGTTVTFYRNGSPWGTATVATINSDSGQNMIIGSDPASSAGTEYNGKMDELYIASTALTANQIRTMYALGKGLYY